METIIVGVGIAVCGIIIGNVLGYRQGLADGQRIVKEVHEL